MSREKVIAMTKRIADGMRKSGQKPDVEAIRKKAIETAKKVEAKNGRRG